MTAENPEKVMTFREHLGELRSVFVRIALALIVGFFIGWEFRRDIFQFLSAPVTAALADNGIYHYQAINIAESIIVYLKAVLIADIAVLSPFIFYQVWSFVSPGLLDREKAFVLPVTGFSVLFFAIGAAFSYQVILPFITDWLVKLTIDDGSVQMLVTMQNAYSTSFTFLLMFGLVFELPLVLYFLALFGAATHKSLLKFWRYFVVISFIVSAILTPPDPISQVLMAVPLNALYGFGILVAWAVVRARAQVELRGDEAADDRPSVGVSALRTMAAALLLVVVAGAMVIVVVRSLPGLQVTDMIPKEATWVAGVNPYALESWTPLDRLMRDTVGADAPSEAIEAAGIPRDEVSEVAVIDLGERGRLAIVRAGGIGARSDALTDELGKRAHGGGDYAVTVGAVDENTLAFGTAAAFDAMAAVVAEEAEPAAPTEAEERLLQRIQAAGPAWAWIPQPEDRAAPLLGESIAPELDAAGAWLSVHERTQLTFELRAPDNKRADTLEARVNAASLSSRSTRAREERDELIDAVRELAGIVRQRSDRSTAARVTAIESRLEALVGPEKRAARLSIPAFTAVGDEATGWSVRREGPWITITAEFGELAVDDLMSVAGVRPAPASL